MALSEFATLYHDQFPFCDVRAQSGTMREQDAIESFVKRRKRGER